MSEVGHDEEQSNAQQRAEGNPRHREEHVLDEVV
jgi:hypothetical protein